MVGGGEDSDSESNIAVPISEWLELTRNTMCP
jgi:hypothetical protein